MQDYITAICRPLANAHPVSSWKIVFIFLLLVRAALASGTIAALTMWVQCRRPLELNKCGRKILQESNARIKSTILTCLLWNIWKCMNAKVFRQEDEVNSVIAQRCKVDLVLWSYRCSSPSDKMKIIEWSNIFLQVQGLLDSRLVFLFLFFFC